MNPELDLQLWQAVRMGDTALVCDLLFRDGADPNWRNPQFHEYSPLLLATVIRRAGMVELLLAHPGINVNLPQAGGEVALHLACRWGSPAILQLLLQHPQIHPAPTSPLNMTPLWLACWKNRLDCVKVYLASGKPLRLGFRLQAEGSSMVPWTNMTALEVSQARGHHEISCLLLQFKEGPAACRARLRRELCELPTFFFSLPLAHWFFLPRLARPRAHSHPRAGSGSLA